MKAELSDRKPTSNAAHHKISSAHIGILICLLLMLLQFKSDNRMQSISVFTPIFSKNTTSSANSASYDPPTNITIKKRNIVHSNSASDYSIMIGSMISRNLLQLLMREGTTMGLLRGRWKPKKSKGSPTGLRKLERNDDDDENDSDNDDGSDDDDEIGDYNSSSYVCSREHRLRLRERIYNKKMKRRTKRYHELDTKCPTHIRLRPGEPTIVTAPDFFCSVDILDKLLVQNWAMMMRSPEKKVYDTKIIHMVRDPFEMALSNYFYHSQQPTPENWVEKDCNPCDTEYYDRYSKPTNSPPYKLV
jgi:hypothetical protein